MALVKNIEVISGDLRETVGDTSVSLINGSIISDEITLNAGAKEFLANPINRLQPVGQISWGLSLTTWTASLLVRATRSSNGAIFKNDYYPRMWNEVIDNWGGASVPIEYGEIFWLTFRSNGIVSELYINDTLIETGTAQVLSGSLMDLGWFGSGFQCGFEYATMKFYDSYEAPADIISTFPIVASDSLVVGDEFVGLMIEEEDEGANYSEMNWDAVGSQYEAYYSQGICWCALTKLYHEHTDIYAKWEIMVPSDIVTSGNFSDSLQLVGVFDTKSRDSVARFVAQLEWTTGENFSFGYVQIDGGTGIDISSWGTFSKDDYHEVELIINDTETYFRVDANEITVSAIPNIPDIQAVMIGSSLGIHPLDSSIYYRDLTFAPASTFTGNPWYYFSQQQ